MKKPFVRRTCSVVLILGLYVFMSSFPAIAQEGALDGKTLVGTMGEIGKGEGDIDELVFKDGKFQSKACEKYGFGDAAYTATVSGNTTTFESETASKEEGKMKWRGKIVGDKLEGTATLDKDGQAPVEYWFKTQLKN
jgi:hypothetical protein